MHDNDYILQFHIDLENIVETEMRGVAGQIKCAWLLGGCDVSKPVTNYLWYKGLALRDKYMACGGRQDTFEALMVSIESIASGDYKISNVVKQNCKWNKILCGEQGKIVFYATSPRILEYMRPILCAMTEDFVLLTHCNVNYKDALPECATIVSFTLTKTEVFENQLLAGLFPKIYCYANTIRSYIDALKPSLIVCMDGCQTEYQLAALFCGQKGIPSVCLQLGWPSMLHEGFHDMPYTYFLTWGKGFSELWEMRNKSIGFIDTGYPYNVEVNGDHSAITFFLQAPVFLLTDAYLGRMYKLITDTAMRYGGCMILVREHPDYQVDEEQKKRWKELPNINIVSDLPLADVFARTQIAVSCYSSSIMESVVHGCVPLVFCLATGARYNPDIEDEGIGFIVDSEVAFFEKLESIKTSQCNTQALHDRTYWFYKIGENAVKSAVEIISHLAGCK